MNRVRSLPDGIGQVLDQYLREKEGASDDAVAEIKPNAKPLIRLNEHVDDGVPSKSRSVTYVPNAVKPRWSMKKVAASVTLVDIVNVDPSHPSPNLKDLGRVTEGRVG